MSIDWVMGTRHGSGVPPVTDLTISYLTRASDNTAKTTYTFSSQTLGAAPTGSQERWIVVGVVLWSEDIATVPNLTAVTVGGNAATVEVQDEDATADVSISLATIKVNTGTTADVVVTCDADTDNCAVCLFRVITEDSQDLQSTQLRNTEVSGIGAQSQTLTNVGLEAGSVYVGIAAIDFTDSGTGIAWEDASDSSPFGTEAFDETLTGSGHWNAIYGANSVNDAGFDIDVIASGGGGTEDMVCCWIQLKKE